jgi:protein kinase A
MSKGYDKAVDYWALGCLIFELYLARTPFQADYTTKIFQNIIAAEKVLSFPRGMDPLHVNLIKKLLSVNPAFRLGTLSNGIDDIINDPFFSTVDWPSIIAQKVTSPYSPPVSGGLDSSNFDDYEEEESIPEYEGPQEHFELF